MKKFSIILVLFVIFISNLRFFDCNYCVFASNLSDDVIAESMVTIEKNSGRILYSKNENKRLPMASTTKIITAIVAIENCNDLDKKHLITKEMTGVEGSSIYLKAGEHLSVRELLYGLMLRSGNDSAVAIAIIVFGSVEKCVEKMNEFCIVHELADTHIVTVNGLHDKDHYTSAVDLARASSYALSNDIFAEIVKTKEKVIDNELDSTNRCRLLKNKNKLLKMVDGADGVKTGYTSKAGRCFVGSATRGDMQVICVLLNSRPMFEECSRLIDKAFEEFSMVKLFSANKNISQDSFRTVFIKNDVLLPLRKKEISKIKAKPNFFDNKKSDNQIGTLDFMIENDLIFSEKIYTIEAEKNDVNSNFISRLRKIVRCF